MTSLALQIPRIWSRRSQREEPVPLSFQLPSMLGGKPRSKSVDAHRRIRRKGMTEVSPILHPVFDPNGTDVEIILDGPAPEPLRSHPPTHRSFPSRGGYDLMEVAPRRGRVPRRELFHAREPSRGRSPVRVVVARESSSRDRGTFVSYSPTRRITIETVHRPHSRSRSSRRSSRRSIDATPARSSSRSGVPVLHMEPLEGIGQPSRRSSRRSVVSRTPSPARSRDDDASPLSTASPVSSISSYPSTPRRRPSSRGPPPLTHSPIQRRREPLASVLEAPTPTFERSPIRTLVRQRSYTRERGTDQEPPPPPPPQRTFSAPVLSGVGNTDAALTTKPARYRYIPAEDDHTRIKEYVRELERGGHRRARPASVPPSGSSTEGGSDKDTTSRRRRTSSRGHKRTQSASFIASETNIWPSPSLGFGHHKRASTSAIGGSISGSVAGSVSGKSRSRSLRRSVSFTRTRDIDSVAPSESVSTIGARSEAKPTSSTSKPPSEASGGSRTSYNLARALTSPPASKASYNLAPSLVSSSASKREYDLAPSPSGSSSASKRSYNLAPSPTSSSASKFSYDLASSPAAASSSSPAFLTSARKRTPPGAAPKFSERFSVCLSPEPEADADGEWESAERRRASASAAVPVTNTAEKEKEAHRMRRVRKMLRFADYAPGE